MNKIKGAILSDCTLVKTMKNQQNIYVTCVLCRMHTEFSQC